MTDEELMEEFINVETTDDAITFFIKEISWAGPCTPVTRWTNARVLLGNTTSTKIQNAKQQLIEDERFFRICPECAQRQPNGWMMEEYCQGCGAENHGIVF